MYMDCMAMKPYRRGITEEECISLPNTKTNTNNRFDHIMPEISA